MPPMPCRPPADILACPHVGALLLELGGAPKCLDLVASRRLAFAANENGGTVVMLREGAEAEPSAALTRWQVSSRRRAPMTMTGAIRSLTPSSSATAPAGWDIF